MWPGQGLGEELLRNLIDIARKEGVGMIVGPFLPDNTEMQRLCEELGFKLDREVTEATVWAEWELNDLGQPGTQPFIP